MKNRFLTSCIAIGVSMLLMLAGLSVSAQSDGVKYEKTIQYSFPNTCNEFNLYGVGKVVLKGSDSDRIRCEVFMTGYGKTIDEAKGRVENVSVDPSNSKGKPNMRISMIQGHYNDRKCKIVTTVYLPPTVVFQHNENIDIVEYLFRVWDKLMN